MNTYVTPGESARNCAISWQAVVGGAIIAAAVSLSLLLLGTGLGLATISPWSENDFSVVKFSITAVVWLIVMQWIASGFGGYLAGRLRTKWTDVQGDEVLFRDTAHGFLAWALATLLTAAFLTGTMTTIIGAGGEAATTALTASATGDEESIDSLNDPLAYYVDDLYRTTHPGPAITPEMRRETARIVLQGIRDETFPDNEKSYLADLVAARTGVSHAEASARVDQLEADIAAAKKTADEARKAAATFSILTFLSLLIGAFIASVAAGLGGLHRDRI